MGKKRVVKKVKKVPVQKASDAEFANLSAMADSTRVKKMTPKMVPCATIPREYYRQLMRLRKSSAFDEIPKKTRRKKRKPRKA